jgi:hypothetical protein
MIGNDPALVLLDPIGLKAINAEACRELLDRQGKTDLFVIVDFSIVHRTRGMLDESGEPLVGRRSAPKLAANVDAFYAGSKAWRQVPLSLSPEERERTYLRLTSKKFFSAHSNMSVASPFARLLMRRLSTGWFTPRRISMRTC